MAIAPRTQSFLDENHVAYTLLPHARAESARGAALAAHVPPERLAKAVLLNDVQGYLLAVVPASHRLELERLREELDRRLELASELELAAIFADCEIAALPPFGAAYGIPTVVDDALLHLTDLYFEAGRPDALGRMAGADFARLFLGRPHGSYGVPVAHLNTPAQSVQSQRVRHEYFRDDLAHVFSLASFGAGLRSQTEYDRNGHTGLLLLKSPELRVVLEAMRPGTALGTHVVHGPATLFVLEGALDVVTDRDSFRVGENEMATLPREERREIRSPVESLFLLALGRPTASPAAAATPELRVVPGAKTRRILIIANRTARSATLLAALRARVDAGPCELVLLAPGFDAGASWTRTEGQARAELHQRIEAACAGLRELGAPVRSTIGDLDPLRAVQDLLLVEGDDFDEIIVSTLPAPLSGWLKMDLATRIARRFGIPVTHVAAED
jgi:Ala-tRNA(Pro) deacylase